MKKPSKDDNDKQLFREAIKGVRRLTTDKTQLTRRKPAPKLRAPDPHDSPGTNDNLTNEFEPVVNPDTDAVSFKRPGIQKQTLRKLKQGKFAIEAELDLHGLRVAQAQQALIQFINRCSHEGRRCVHIIHGKGHHTTETQGVLKTGTHRWLPQIDAVQAFCSAQPRDGGSGAVYVLLKRS